MYTPSAGDIASAIQAVNYVVQVLQIDAIKEYRGFRDDVRAFERIAENLQRTLDGLGAEDQSHGAFNALSTKDRAVALELMGNFRTTITDCTQLLAKYHRMERSNSVAQRTKFKIRVQQDIARLQAGLQSHVMKVKMILEPLERGVSDHFGKGLRKDVIEAQEENRKLFHQIKELLLTSKPEEANGESSSESYSVQKGRAPVEARDRRRPSTGFSADLFDRLNYQYNDFEESVRYYGKEDLFQRILDAFHHHLGNAAAVSGDLSRNERLSKIHIVKCTFLMQVLENRLELRQMASETVVPRYVDSLRKRCLEEVSRIWPDLDPQKEHGPESLGLGVLTDDDLRFWLVEDDEQDNIEDIDIERYIVRYSMRSRQSETHKVGLLTHKADELEVRSTITRKGRFGVLQEFPNTWIDLKTVVFRPLWLSQPSRAVLDADISLNSQMKTLRFSDREDSWQFQNAITGYEIAFQGRLCPYKENAGGKWVAKGVASFEIWEKQRLDEPPFLPDSASESPVGPVRRRTNSTGDIPGQRLRTGSFATDASSLAASTGSAIPKRPTIGPPLLVLYVQYSEPPLDGYTCLAMELSDDIETKFNCSCKNRDQGGCGHVSIEKRGGGVRRKTGLLPLRKLAPSAEDRLRPNVAALGMFQHGEGLSNMEPIRDVGAISLQFGALSDTVGSRDDFCKELREQIVIYRRKKNEIQRRRMESRGIHGS